MKEAVEGDFIGVWEIDLIQEFVKDIHVFKLNLKFLQTLFEFHVVNGLSFFLNILLVPNILTF